MSHKTDAGEARKEVNGRMNRLRKLEKEIEKSNLSQAEIKSSIHAAELEASRLEIAARLQDLNLWTLTKERDTCSGKRRYEYWYASWRERGRVRNVYLGSKKKISRDDALRRARNIKRSALIGLNQKET